MPEGNPDPIAIFAGQIVSLLCHRGEKYQIELALQQPDQYAGNVNANQKFVTIRRNTKTISKQKEKNYPEETNRTVKKTVLTKKNQLPTYTITRPSK